MKKVLALLKAVKWKRSIRSKLLLASFAMLVIPTLALGILSYFVATQETDRLIEQNLRNNVRATIQTAAAFHQTVMSGSATVEQAQEQMKTMLLGTELPDGRRPGNRNIDLGENGYFYILDEQGNIIVHPDGLRGENIINLQDNEEEKQNIQNILENGKSGGGITYHKGLLPGSDKTGEMITYAQKTTYWGWIIVANSYKMDFDEAQSNIFNVVIITLVICLVLGALFAYLFASHISKPIAKIAGETKRIADGELIDTDIIVKNRDETGQLAANFNLMNRNLKLLLQQVINSSEKVSSSSKTLNEAVGEITETSKHTTEKIEEIASGIEVQAEGTEQSSKAMEEMTEGIRRIADSSSQAYEVSSQSEKEALQGNQFIQKSTEQMNLINDRVSELVNIINTLSDHSREIGEIVQVINDISTQTGLLSLNASIEAARAGEAGRGFAVVASEIKKLSQMTNESSGNIIERVNVIQGSIQSAVEAMEQSGKDVREGVALIQQTGESFARITEAAAQAAAQIEETSAAAQQMSASSEEIFASLQEIERVASESSASVQSISASSNEQLASMNELKEAAGQLAQMASDLKQASSKFKI